MQVKLEGITKYGKERIRKHGETWTVLETRTRVECLGGKIGFKLESLADTLRENGGMTKDMRWVAIQGDENFKVQVIT